MKNLSKLLFGPFFLILIGWNVKNFAQEINDVIPIITLESGIPDTVLVSDLFYSREYNVSFSSSDVINVSYNKEENSLALLPDKNYEGIRLLPFELNNEKYVIPILVLKKQIINFKYTPSQEYDELTLFGSFNTWNRHQYYFKDPDSNGVYDVSIPLSAGRYEYKFYGDGEELLDPANPDKVANGLGGFNSVLIVPENKKEKIFLHHLNFDGKEDESIFIYYLESEKNQNLSKDNIIADLNNKPVDNKNIVIEGNRIELMLPADLLKGEKTLRVAVNLKGNVSNIQVAKIFNRAPVGVNNEYFTWYDGIIYSLMIDRFSDGDESINNPIKKDSLRWKANYMGGDFQGIINKIDEGYFDSLGVNVLWISPVYDNPDSAYKEYPKPHRWFSGYHGYWPINSKGVEEKFGTFKELKKLVKLAHKHNLKVLLDFVSNHVHELNPLFKEHRNWFGQLSLPDGRLNLRFWDEFRLTTWFEPYMPSFDYQNSSEAVDYITDNAVWWLKQTGADGYRHDAVKHVPYVFWRALTRKLKSEFEPAEHKNVYQIGETFGDYNLVKSYVNPGQLSAQFNFDLYNVAQAVFIDSNRSFVDLDKEMKKGFSVFGYLNLMGNIMDSHDKNRYMAYADGDLELSQWSAIEEGWNNPPKVDHPLSYKKAELYYAYMNSIPGLPVIYYGSEFGMTGASDPDNRRMMRFGDQLNNYEKDMLKVVSKIIHIRKNHSALRYGNYYTLVTQQDCYAFIRSDFNERVLVVLNKSNGNKNINITLPEFYNISEMKNLYDGSVININDDKTSVRLPAYGWGIFKLD